MAYLPWNRAICQWILTHKEIIIKCITILTYAILPLVFVKQARNITGQVALILLWVILWLPIMVQVFDSIMAKRLMLFRKQLGIFMGVLALVHTVIYFVRPKSHALWSSAFWVEDNTISFMAIGFAAVVISSLLALTSNDYSMRLLRKGWKRLHRTVYVLVILGVLHTMFIDLHQHHKHPDRPFSYTELYVETLLPIVLYGIGKLLEARRVKLLHHPI